MAAPLPPPKIPPRTAPAAAPSPTCAFSELSSSLMRTLSCVPAGTVTFCGTGGAAGALGAVFWDWYELPLPELSDAGTVVRNPLSPRFSLYLRDGLDFLVFVVVARRGAGAAAGSGACGVLSTAGGGVLAADAT